jgi:glycerol-3-phosphate dehydrogenase subunit B
MTFDVLVIGGGVAGFSAALAAQQRGARTALVRAAPGASALVSGAWSGPLPAEIRSALEQAGYSLQATSSPLAHERGRTISADFAAAAHARATPTAQTTICGIAGLPHFNAQILAQLWSSTPLRFLEIELPGTPAGGWSAVSVAAHIERDPAMVVQTLNGKSGHFIFPAILGAELGQNVLNALHAAGIEAAEALAATPSLPGWRLLKATERALQNAGVTVLTGRTIVGHTVDGRVHDVRIDSDVVSAKSFVLATGKYTAGGIVADSGFRESVFGLPVWLEHLGDVFASPDPLPLTDPVRTEEQPLLLAGVHTDDAAHPIDRTERVMYENVFVAGTIRAGWNAAHTGLGFCAEDGWNAGVSASA